MGGTPASVGHVTAEFERKLGSLGYVQGRNLNLLTRIASPSLNVMEEAVQALVPSVDVLAVWGTIGGMAAKKFAASVPVVFLSVGAPVEVGLVASLAKPGGNMTGITFEATAETYAKRLHMLREILPDLRRVAVLRARGDVNVPFAMASLQGAGLGITLIPIDIGTEDDLNAAFAEARHGEAQAVLVVAGALTYASRKRVAELALAHRLPSSHAFRETVIDGGLVSLGPDLLVMAGQGASYVDKILRGAKPAELPVQQPARYEVYVNMGTAKALGLIIPPSVLARADVVIEQ